MQRLFLSTKELKQVVVRQARILQQALERFPMGHDNADHIAADLSAMSKKKKG